MSSLEPTLCFRCHYDLRGVADDQPCPECGLLAERSRRPTDALRDARPKWLRNLSIGVWLILLAIVVAVVSPALGQTVFRWASARWPTSAVVYGPFLGMPRPSWTSPDRLLPLLYYMGYDLAALFILLGVFQLTRAEGYEPVDREDRRRRINLRVAALIPLIIAIVIGCRSYTLAWLDELDDSEWWSAFLLAVVTAACVPLPLLLFAQLRNLAARARSAHLAEHCTIVGRGIAASMIVAYAIYLFSSNIESFGLRTTWFSRSPVWLGILGLIATAGVLFWLWSIYLMIRFAIAFGKASRESRRAWKAADRSAV